MAEAGTAIVGPVSASTLIDSSSLRLSVPSLAMISTLDKPLSVKGAGSSRCCRSSGIRRNPILPPSPGDAGLDGHFLAELVEAVGEEDLVAAGRQVDVPESAG